MLIKIILIDKLEHSPAHVPALHQRHPPANFGHFRFRQDGELGVSLQPWRGAQFKQPLGVRHKRVVHATALHHLRHALAMHHRLVAEGRLQRAHLCLCLALKFKY